MIGKKNRELRHLNAELAEWADREEGWEEMIEWRDRQLFILQRETRRAIARLTGELIRALHELEAERLYRVSAQRGLVANYQAARDLTNWFRKHELVPLVAKMWELGLDREIGYDPLADRELRRFFTNQVLAARVTELMNGLEKEAVESKDRQIHDELAALHGWDRTPAAFMRSAPANPELAQLLK